MIGVSLPFAWLEERRIPGDDWESLLSTLREWGVESIELRTVRAHHSPESVRRVMEDLWDRGFLVTVHSAFTAADTAVEEVFGPLKAVLPCLRQPHLNLTVHPIGEGLTRALLALSDAAGEYPVTISLENNRLLPGKIQGDSTRLVLDTVTEVARDNVGICFDLGHFAYYQKKNRPDEPSLFPPKEFCRKMRHTHIHALDGLRTHFPLGVFELPLEEYLQGFSWEYFGVYNLELDFPRIAENWTPREALRVSIEALKKAMPHCAVLKDRTRKELDGAFLGAVEKVKEGERRFSLIHSTSYLFHTRRFFWGMDLAFRHGRTLAQTPRRAGEILKDLELMILTHGHRDHFEESTLRLLSKGKTRFLVPEFLRSRALELGIPEENLLVARAGVPMTVGPLTVLPFESRHFRPDGNGVEEYGYHVTLWDGTTLLFPGDIRDFDLSKAPVVPEADVLFAHLWLGDDNRHGAYRENIAPWADFMLSFAPKTLLLTHLYENGRPDHKMWRLDHAQEAVAELKRKRPDLTVILPDWGETLDL